MKTVLKIIRKNTIQLLNFTDSANSCSSPNFRSESSIFSLQGCNGFIRLYSYWQYKLANQRARIRSVFVKHCLYVNPLFARKNYIVIFSSLPLSLTFILLATQLNLLIMIIRLIGSLFVDGKKHISLVH